MKKTTVEQSKSGPVIVREGSTGGC